MWTNKIRQQHCSCLSSSYLWFLFSPIQPVVVFFFTLCCSVGEFMLCLVHIIIIYNEQNTLFSCDDGRNAKSVRACCVWAFYNYYSLTCNRQHMNRRIEGQSEKGSCVTSSLVSISILVLFIYFMLHLVIKKLVLSPRSHIKCSNAMIVNYYEHRTTGHRHRRHMNIFLPYCQSKHSFFLLFSFLSFV